jgi:osmotically-inducible protein OsmY
MGTSGAVVDALIGPIAPKIAAATITDRIAAGPPMINPPTKFILNHCGFVDFVDIKPACLGTLCSRSLTAVLMRINVKPFSWVENALRRLLMEANMTDSQLRQDVIDELEFDPSFSGEHIGVAVDKNVVTLTGHVNSYAEKLAAIAATRRVKGVHAIAENIEVRYSYQNKTADDQIAKRACDILNWDVVVPADGVDVLVQDGWVTLSGNVDWYYQKTAAEDDVRRLSGVRGVTNKITIKPRIDSANVKSKIESALKRLAEVEAKAIRVTVQDGSKVVLEGKVDNWDERRAVENAAWSTAGVASVEDRLTIG